LDKTTRHQRHILCGEKLTCVLACMFIGVTFFSLQSSASERIFSATPYLMEAVDRPASTSLIIKPPNHSEGRIWRAYIRSSASLSDDAVLVFSEMLGNREIARQPIRRYLNGAWTPRFPASAVVVHSIPPVPFEPRWIGVTISYTDPQTIVGEDNIERISRYNTDATLLGTSRGVARLSVGVDLSRDPNKSDDGYSTYCTAFLVREDLVLTAGHCVNDELGNTTVELEFGYLAEQQTPVFAPYDISVFARSDSLDAVLLKFWPSHDSQYVFNFSNTVNLDIANLLILQHSHGGPLSVSRDDDCRAVAKFLTGPPLFDRNGKSIANPTATLQHGCDTTKSSSGSPVLDRATQKVVGMHRRGYLAGEPRVNHAIHSSHLVQWLQSVSPAANPQFD